MSTSDIELHRRWIHDHDTNAFSELVRAHSRMVYATCRRILRNTSDAEEITQECFWKFAREKSLVRSSAAAWLHTVATRLSLNRLKSDTHRRARELRYTDESTPADGQDWSEMSAHIDEAIASLPDTLRTPLLRHYFEDETHETLAQEEGVAQSTITRRIQRAIEEIRDTLNSKQVAFGGVAAISALLGSQEAAALPSSLTSSLIKIGFSAPAKAGTAASKIVGASWMLKGAALAALSATVIAASWWATRESSGEVGLTPESVVSSTALITDATTDLPELPAQLGYVRAEAPIAPVVRDARPTPERHEIEEEEPAPEVTPVATVSVSGSVINERGDPVAGARVWVLDPPYWPRDFSSPLYKATTGTDGRYIIHDIPQRRRFDVSAGSPGYEQAWKGLDYEEEQDSVTADFTLKDGLTLYGRVLSEDRQPVSDAVVSVPGYVLANTTGSGGRRATAITDEQGRFSYGFNSEGFVVLKVAAPDRGHFIFHDVSVGSDEEQVLVLKPHGVIRGRVTRLRGESVQGLKIVASGWILMHSPGSPGRNRVTARTFTNSSKTESDGSYTIENLPSGLEYRMRVVASAADASGRSGYLSAEEVLGVMKPNGEMRWDPRIQASMRIAGSIRSQTSGKLLDSIQVGIVRNAEDSTEFIIADGGTYEYELFEPGNYFIYPKIPPFDQAPGLAYGKTFSWMSGQDLTLDFDVPGAFALSIRVEDSDGIPIQGAKVLVVKETHNGTSAYHSAETDEEGRSMYASCASGIQHWLRIELDGYVSAESARTIGQPEEVYAEERIVLLRSGGIEGYLRNSDGTLVVDTRVTLYVTDGGGQSASNRSRRFSGVQLYSRTDADGWFSIAEGLPEGRLSISVTPGGLNRNGLSGTINGIDIQGGSIVQVNDIVLVGRPGAGI